MRYCVKRRTRCTRQSLPSLSWRTSSATESNATSRARFRSGSTKFGIYTLLWVRYVRYDVCRICHWTPTRHISLLQHAIHLGRYPPDFVRDHKAYKSVQVAREIPDVPDTITVPCEVRRRRYVVNLPTRTSTRALTSPGTGAGISCMRTHSALIACLMI